MKKILCILSALLISFNASAQPQDIPADAILLTPEQNQKLIEIKENLKKEITPIIEEITSSKARIHEIEKKYFEEFWNMLTKEQQALYQREQSKN